MGKALHLDTKAEFGEIVVEVIDAAGESIAMSKPIGRDGLDIPVEWQTGSIDESNSPLTLRITLKNAHLFALRMT